VSRILWIFLILCGFLSSQTFPAKQSDYCSDPDAIARWDKLVAKYPKDLGIQTLHALWLGLCLKVKRGALSLDQASSLFEKARSALVEKRKEANSVAEARGVYALVTRVYDTLTIVYTGRRGGKDKVRLIGVDCPELKQKPWGTIARDFSRKMVLNKIVRLETDVRVRDKYGRLLAYVWVDEKMLNEELVRNGLAVLLTIPPDVRYVERFKRAQKEARQNKRGFWADGGLDLTPSQFRKIYRKNQ